MIFDDNSYSISELEKIINQKFSGAIFYFKLNEVFVNQLHLKTYDSINLEKEQPMNMFLSEERINKDRIDEVFNIIETSLKMLKHFKVIE